MKVLVTGGAGFIGRYVVEELINSGYDVSVIDIQKQTDACLPEQIRYYTTDIGTWGQSSCHTSQNLDDIFQKEIPDAVIHLAALVDVGKSLANPQLDANTNIVGTINILEYCLKYNVKKLIYASSAAIYGEPVYLGIDEMHPQQPLSFYGVSKQTAETYIKTFSKIHGLHYTILRYANVYGPASHQKPGGDVISVFLDAISADEKPKIYGDGNQSRDFIFVKDVAKATISALHHGDRLTFNISTNKPTTLNEIVEKINTLFGKQLTPIYLPARTGDISESYLTNEKARKHLYWQHQYTLDQGLQLTFDKKKQ